MARQQLIGNIHALDARLTLQQHALRLNGQQRVARLRQMSPLWLLGGGVAAGLLAGRLVGRRNVSGIRTLGVAGLYSWILGGIRLWRLSGSLLPELGNSAIERDA